MGARVPLCEIPLHDAEGTDIRLLTRFEQIAVDPANGALPSRLHHQGKVIGRSAHLVYVLFDYGHQGIVALPPHLLRLIDTPPPWASPPGAPPTTTDPPTPAPTSPWSDVEGTPIPLWC